MQEICCMKQRGERLRSLPSRSLSAVLSMVLNPLVVCSNISPAVHPQ